MMSGGANDERLVHHLSGSVRPSGFPPPVSGFRNEFWFVLPSMRPPLRGGVYTTYLLTFTYGKVVS